MLTLPFVDFLPLISAARLATISLRQHLCEGTQVYQVAVRLQAIVAACLLACLLAGSLARLLACSLACCNVQALLRGA